MAGDNFSCRAFEYRDIVDLVNGGTVANGSFAAVLFVLSGIVRLQGEKKRMYVRKNAWQ